MFSAMNAHLDQISHTGDGFSSTFDDGRGRTFGSGSSTPNSSTSYLSKMVKLDFPHFNGLEDPTRDAQLWFQLMKEETPITTWATFKQGLHDRYSPTQFQDFFARRITPYQQIGCFVSGLKENIKTDVQACKPQTLSAAIGLARLYESRNKKLGDT
ncbi:unnamed protein product [Prunus armeniaca]|uniref:Retrotransposon gag domain-containing protein n=1 Tax=Prunus armeniaca TaxID=36596 RepID=A0A6J5V3D8_PRUAR|nr:unnamed protein product [Prunus armeniaca]